VAAQTRGFLFSDLRGYSAFTERHGDRAARALLAEYRQIVRRVIGDFDGAEIRTEGDSFYVVFDSVGQAVDAGLAIQASLRTEPSEPILAGIGVHAGEVEDDADQGIVSGAVNVAARVCAEAAPGEVLVSETVRLLTRTYLEVRFVPRGRRRLKGITDPVPVYEALPGRGMPPALHRWRRPTASNLAVAGVAFIAIMAAVGVAAMDGGGIPFVSGESHLSSDLSASRTRSSADATPRDVSADPSVTRPDAGTAGEERLLAIVDDALHPTCKPAEQDSLPALYGPGDAGNNWTARRTVVSFIAGITCEPFGLGSPDELSLWLLSAPGHPSPAVVSADEWIANRAGWLGIGRGSCAEDRRAVEAWTAGPVHGELMCSSTDSAAILYWTYAGDSVVGRVVSMERDLDALLAWWGREARFRDP
jgi:class 3 adenylate cyclase